ncbi:hypothetical protein BZG29_17075 [Janthinobacterium sp. LM6]|uniref:hypothetical protein n=1 Tax=Janthinobacterium sp. LM6 TaxID=1938606 RepID=UPI000983958B|nr:hypothetical protein [Janthinobacterium sp. LM6]AQR69845.1 hypothetical protein BZG29_17075 [Janthinobacterium sp. LM6]
MTHHTQKDLLRKANRIAAALSDEVDALTDEQLMQEAQEDGLDTAKLGNEFRSSAMKLIAEAKRQKLALARQRLAESQQNRATEPRLRPSLESIKQRIQAVLAIRPNLAVAFRDGKTLSDDDWLSLWDDFIEMGAVKDNHDPL